MGDFSKFDKQIDLDQIRKDADEIKKNGGTGDYPEIEEGEYRVKCENLEIGETGPNSKGGAGRPMLKAMFRIIEGEHKKQCLFYNQVFTRGFPQHKGLEFLRSLKVFDDNEVDFDGNFENFNDLLLDIAEEAESSGLMYEVTKSHDGDYTRLDITDVYES